EILRHSRRRRRRCHRDLASTCRSRARLERRYRGVLRPEGTATEVGGAAWPAARKEPAETDRAGDQGPHRRDSRQRDLPQRPRAGFPHRHARSCAALLQCHVHRQAMDVAARSTRQGKNRTMNTRRSRFAMTSWTDVFQKDAAELLRADDSIDTRGLAVVKPPPEVPEEKEKPAQLSDSDAKQVSSLVDGLDRI